MHRKDIVSRSSNVNIRNIDKNVKNVWKWEWLDKQVNDVYLRECIRKLESPGVAYCIICSKELYYKSRGCVALTDHVKTDKHVARLQLRKDNFALPGAGDCNKEDTVSPYGLHPMYTAYSPIAEANVPQPSIPVVDRVANNEAMLLSFLAEKSLPFSIAPDLIEFTKQLSNDRKALDSMTMHRTAAAYKLRFGVSKTFKENLIRDLKSTFFSLNSDETTSNNHQKIVTLLVNYLADEKIVTKHLESFSVNTVNSKSIFEGIQNVFESNNIPWENLMSILLDSCNVMRGKKAGVETKMRAHCPHLLDIDGDSCHHAHNAAKAFCKPFSRYLENLVSDVHNDFKWSPDLRAVFSLICEILNIKYTMPKNFISFRWLSIYDAAQDLSRLFDALVIFYFSFLSSSMKTEFLHIIVKIFKHHEVGEVGRSRIRNLQASLHKKLLTKEGKDRKDRIVTKLINDQLKTKLNLYFFISVLPLLQEYIKFFQKSTPLIHLLHDKQIELLKEFMACFMKPEVLLSIGDSGKKLKKLCVDEPKNHLSSKNIFIGESAKKIISLAPKRYSDVVKTFRENSKSAYIAGARALQSKMPISNRFLQAVSSIDPRCRKHSVSLEFMKELPNFVKNIITCEESERYDLEVQKYHVDSLRQPNDDESIDTWWVEIKRSGKYPLLSKLALALITCFHGPKVESSFSVMNSIVTPGSSRLNVSTFNAIQSVKYELSARRVSSFDLFKRDNYLTDPIDKNLSKNMRTAYKGYREEKLLNKTTTQSRKNELEVKNKALTKIAAKKLSERAVKKQRKDHAENLKKKISPQNLSEKKEVQTVAQVETVCKQIVVNTKCDPPPSKKRKVSKNVLTIKEMFAKANMKSNNK